MVDDSSFQQSDHGKQITHSIWSARVQINLYVRQNVSMRNRRISPLALPRDRHEQNPPAQVPDVFSHATQPQAGHADQTDNVYPNARNQFEQGSMAFRPN